MKQFDNGRRVHAKHLLTKEKDNRTDFCPIQETLSLIFEVMTSFTKNHRVELEEVAKPAGFLCIHSNAVILTELSKQEVAPSSSHNNNLLYVHVKTVFIFTTEVLEYILGVH